MKTPNRLPARNPPQNPRRQSTFLASRVVISNQRTIFSDSKDLILPVKFQQAVPTVVLVHSNTAYSPAAANRTGPHHITTSSLENDHIWTPSYGKVVYTYGLAPLKEVVHQACR